MTATEGPESIGRIPDRLWVERTRARARYERAWQRFCDAFPGVEDADLMRLERKRLLAEAAEMRDTSLRWHPGACRTHRKLAIVHWYLANDTGAETHRKTALRHAREWLRGDSGNWYAYYVAGLLLAADEAWDEARRALEEAKRLVSPSEAHIVEQAIGGLPPKAEEPDLFHQPAGSVAEGDGTREFREGARRVRVTGPPVRSRALREAALTHYGMVCGACGLDAEVKYGAELARGALHVHHRTPLGQVGETNVSVDDVIVLCANCHGVLHAAGRGCVSSGAPERLSLLCASQGYPNSQDE